MNQHQSDIVICNRYYVFESGKKYLRYNDKTKDLIMDSEQAIFELNNFRNFDMSAWGKLYNKALFENINFPEGKLSEDYYIMYLLFDKANKIVYHAEPLYFYLQRKSSISKQSKINMDFIEASYQQMTYVEKKYPNLKTCVRVAYASANMTVYNILLKNKGKCDKKIIEKLQKEVENNLESILKYEYWSTSKKIQAYLFVNDIHIYNIAFRLFKIVKKV